MASPEPPQERLSFRSEFHVGGKGTRMASYRTTPTHSAAPAARPRPTRTLSVAPSTPGGGSAGPETRGPLCAGLHRKQEREDTVASQVDPPLPGSRHLSYDIAPTSVFIDEGVSGARLDRPALDRLRDLAAEGAYEVLLVTVPDRLARRYAYQVLLVEEFTRGGCEVVFVQHGLGASPEEQMLLQMQGVFAEYERALIQERTRRGRLFRRAKGG